MERLFESVVVFSAPLIAIHMRRKCFYVYIALRKSLSPADKFITSYLALLAFRGWLCKEGKRKEREINTDKEKENSDITTIKRKQTDRRSELSD